MELHALTQIECDLLVVVGECPAFGEHRLRLVIGIQADQLLPDNAQLVKAPFGTGCFTFQCEETADIAEAERAAIARRQASPLWSGGQVDVLGPSWQRVRNARRSGQVCGRDTRERGPGQPDTETPHELASAHRSCH